MNTSSKRFPSFRGGAALLGLILAACIQGPWDYYPDDSPPFRGAFVSGYVLAGKPLEHICFERVLDIAEERTQAFAWYDSASVTVSGPFSGTSRTVTLTAMPDMPNCFLGDTGLRAERGSEYALTADFKWDSAGHTVVSHVVGRAQVPHEFSIHRTAAAPTFAKTGGIPNNIFDLAFLTTLPPNVRDTLLAEYGDTLGKIRNDSVALRKYILANGAKMQNRLKQLMEGEYFEYHEGDTLYYLNGVLNTLSHYFSADRTPDVQAVLISQRFERTSSRPETRFDSPLGFKPDSGEYYFPGEIRRLLIYPEAKSNKGWSLLDSMGVVNTWFHTQRNRLYFYGMERAYYQYNATATQVQGGGGPEDGDPRIKVKYNVVGGEGFFVGGIPDSFDIYIRTDSLTKSYPLPAAHAFRCRKEGWFDDKDCREYYPVYCREKNWSPADCLPQAYQVCTAPDSADSAAVAMCDTLSAPSLKNAETAKRMATQFCVEKGFPALAACDEARADCLNTPGRNSCKDALWDYCLDRLWKPDQCGAGLASYCHDKPRLSETLCRHADAWCAAHADSPLCK